MNYKKCPVCDGHGGDYGTSSRDDGWIKCQTCDERGEVEAELLDPSCIMGTAYIEALMWSEQDDGEPEITCLELAAEERCYDDCERFLALAAEAEEPLEPEEYAQAGHDLALTRNGHGVGFWDGDWSIGQGPVYTDIAKRMGSVNIINGYGGPSYIVPTPADAAAHGERLYGKKGV